VNPAFAPGEAALFLLSARDRRQLAGSGHSTPVTVKQIEGSIVCFNNFTAQRLVFHASTPEFSGYMLKN
jgi:hypothetical protein